MLSLVTAFLSRYFSWTNGDSHRSRFNCQAAVLSVLCVMFQVWLSFVMSLFDVYLVWLSNFSLNLLLPFRWPKLLLTYPYISCTTFVVSLYINCCILVSSLLPFAKHFLSAGTATSVFYYYYYYYYRKSRAIPLLPLWAFVACSRVNFTLLLLLLLLLLLYITIFWKRSTFFTRMCN